MPNIIPELSDSQIRDIPSKAEQLVYRALKEQLPNDWLVIHSLEYVTHNPKYESHADREADFVIFVPDYGVLVVEVKGGGISYDKTTDSWFSIDRYGNPHNIKNPLRQSKEAKYEIRKHLSLRMGSKNILLAHAALFPDIENLSGLQSHDVPLDILGEASVLNDMKSWALSIFKYWAGKIPNYDPLEINGLNIAQDIYGKKATILPSLALTIKRETEIQIELTNQQKSILRQLKRRKTAIIEGGAGTGKTVLAVDHAQNLAAQGSKVLLLCYNKQLGNELKKRCQGINNLHAMNFHELCNWRINQVKSNTGRNLLEESKLVYPGKDIYDVLMPDALINSYEIAPLAYDTIIIDEGQDFKDEFWLAIELLYEGHEDSRLYIFQDSNQAIYSSSEDLPIDDIPLFLADNCRNTKTIHELAYQFYEGEEIDAPDLEGAPVESLVDSASNGQAQKIDKLISNLINIENILPKDITVLVIGDFNLAVSLLKETKHDRLWVFKDYSPEKHVLVETAKRFKGLESKIIVLWILDEYSYDEKLLYVSISRARLRLWIVGNNEIINKIKR